jgi:hypothetical protein
LWSLGLQGQSVPRRVRWSAPAFDSRRHPVARANPRARPNAHGAAWSSASRHPLAIRTRPTAARWAFRRHRSRQVPALGARSLNRFPLALCLCLSFSVRHRVEDDVDPTGYAFFSENSRKYPRPALPLHPSPLSVLWQIMTMIRPLSSWIAR